MNVLFEEDGAFRAGVVLADNVSSLQVTLPTGRRVKVKATHVLLRFEAPAAAALMSEAEALSEEMAVDFLWEVSPAGEFGFADLAADYFGATSASAVPPVQAAAVLLRLHAAPIYFHRKGRGRFAKAPPEILQAALAGQEKKRLQAEAVLRMAAELVAGKLPEEFKSQLPQLIYAPDRNRPEAKALAQAAQDSGRSEAALLLAAGAVGTTHDYHLGRFLYDCFREGTDFPEVATGNAVALADLPLHDVQAFSIDDAATTEIDDAFSVKRQADGNWCIGIHIAAPGLGFAVDSALGQIARRRLSTVYMPGKKITMLPEAVVEEFTLAAGRIAPAVSLYLAVAPDLRLLSQRTVLSRITIADNLRHHDIEPLFNAATLNAVNAPVTDFAYRDELVLLWEFSQVLAAGRGEQNKPDSNRKDYNFAVDWDAQGVDGPGVVSISERPRGSPLDTLVAELMIFANATWGAALRDAGIPALYRVQTGGKVRMSTVAAPHEGLGVDCYAWSSSPLRRFADLLNQWQLIAWLKNELPPFGKNDEHGKNAAPQSTELFAALRDFELTYAAYADFQRQMERYWCLRYLLQTGATTLDAVVIKESLVRAVAMPLVLRVASLPDLALAPRGALVRLQVEAIDLLTAEMRLRFVEVLANAAGDGRALEETDAAADGAEVAEVDDAVNRAATGNTADLTEAEETMTVSSTAADEVLAEAELHQALVVDADYAAGEASAGQGRVVDHAIKRHGHKAD